MKVEILISTTSSRLHALPLLLLEEREDLDYVVSIQSMNNNSYTIPKEISSRKDIRVFFCEKRGLSENRNNCIRKSKADICFIADDDVSYKNEYIDEVKSRFLKDSDLDILTGKIKTFENEPQYKQYSDKIKRINYFNFKNISSIEIVFRRSSIIKKELSFDPNFGLGSLKFSKGGEESIFIKDAIAKGLKIIYFPFFLVKHPYESSGKKEIDNEEFFSFLGGYTRRIFGRIGFVFILYFFVKYFKKMNTFRKTRRNIIFFFKSFNH